MAFFVKPTAYLHHLMRHYLARCQWGDLLWGDLLHLAMPRDDGMPPSLMSRRFSAGQGDSHSDKLGGLCLRMPAEVSTPKHVTYGALQPDPN